LMSEVDDSRSSVRDLRDFRDLTKFGILKKIFFKIFKKMYFSDLFCSNFGLLTHVPPSGWRRSSFCISLWKNVYNGEFFVFDASLKNFYLFKVKFSSYSKCNLFQSLNW
jgi:hypothetical protein